MVSLPNSKMNTPARLKKIEDKLNLKQGNKHVIWPILGGASGGEPYRNVTPKESEMLTNKRGPVPMCIALSREKEFLEYLESK